MTWHFGMPCGGPFRWHFCLDALTLGLCLTLSWCHYWASITIGGIGARRKHTNFGFAK